MKEEEVVVKIYSRRVRVWDKISLGQRPYPEKSYFNLNSIQLIWSTIGPLFIYYDLGNLTGSTILPTKK